MSERFRALLAFTSIVLLFALITGHCLLFVAFFHKYNCFRSALSSWFYIPNLDSSVRRGRLYTRFLFFIPMSPWLVIDLGGSLVAGFKINVHFLKKLSVYVAKERSRRFFIVVGGGKTARSYQQALRSVGKVDDQSLDRVGIAATLLNAELVRASIAHRIPALVYPSVIADFDERVPARWRVFVCGGIGKGGWSTDYVSLRWAKRLGAKQVVRMSDVKFVWSADPQHPHARPLERLTWDEYMDVYRDTQSTLAWRPGLNMPIDPIAATFGRRNHLTVLVIGDNVASLKKVIKGEKFQGTVIQS